MGRFWMLGLLFWVRFNSELPEAWGLTPDEIRGEIRSQMSQRHPGPTGPFWDRLGAEALPVIRQMYRESSSSYERSWLIDGLSHFSDPEVGELLRNDAEKEQNAVMKKKLLSAYVESQGDASLGFVEPFLSSSDPHIRKALVRAIRDHVSVEKAAPLLSRFKANEKESWVLRALEEKTSPDLRKPKRPGDPALSPARAKNEGSESVKPLGEKELAGEWAGVEVNPRRSGQAKVVLIPVEDQKKGKWKIEWSVPKKPKRTYLHSEYEWSYFQTGQDHWLEIRIKQEDTVFLARRPGKK
jgi:hypothetical protein